MKRSTALVWGTGAVVFLAAAVAAFHHDKARREVNAARLTTICESREMHLSLSIRSSGTVLDVRRAETDAYIKANLKKFAEERRESVRRDANPAVFEQWVKLDKLIFENASGFNGLEGLELESAVAKFGKQRCLESI